MEFFYNIGFKRWTYPHRKCKSNILIGIVYHIFTRLLRFVIRFELFFSIILFGDRFSGAGFANDSNFCILRSAKSADFISAGISAVQVVSWCEECLLDRGRHWYYSLADHDATSKEQRL